MYSDDNLIYVCTLLECIEKVLLYTDEYQDEVELFWANDQLNFNAAWSLLLAIGEGSKKLDDQLKAEFPQIDWRNIVSMRNYLAHDYIGIDKNLLFSVVKVHLPVLKEALVTMVDQINFDDAMLRRALDSTHYRHIQYLRNKLHDRP